MIDFEVAPKTKKRVVEEGSKAHYLVLGDFGGRATEPLSVDRDNIDDVLSRLDVKLAGLRVREIEDFHPDRLYARMEEFRELDEPEDAPSRPAAAPKAQLGEMLQRGSILEQMVEGGDPFERYVRDLARAHAAPAKRDDSARIAAIGEKMEALLHHPRFQAIESAWRGLDLVIREADDEAARVHIAQFTRDELNRDLGEATNLRDTRIVKLLTSRPWKGVIGLYTFASSPADIELLGRIALVAGHAKAPFIAEGSVDMGSHWDELRGIAEAKYLALALPRLLLRAPYGAKSSVVESFQFEEMPGRPQHAHYLWGNPALAVLAVAARGGVPDEDLDLDHLPVHSWQDEGEWKMTPCAEVWLTETQANALIDMGMIPLVSFRDTDRVRVAGLRAINGSTILA